MRYVPHTENGCGKVSEYKKAVAYRVAVFFHVYVYGENKWIGLILHFMSCVCRWIKVFCVDINFCMGQVDCMGINERGGFVWTG